MKWENENKKIIYKLDLIEAFVAFLFSLLNALINRPFCYSTMQPKVGVVFKFYMPSIPSSDLIKKKSICWYILSYWNCRYSVQMRKPFFFSWNQWKKIYFIGSEPRAVFEWFQSLDFGAKKVRSKACINYMNNIYSNK